MANANSILLLGAGGHAASCIDVIEQGNKFTIAGLIGVDSEVGARVLGYSVLGTDADLDALARTYEYALVTVGQIKSPDSRIKLFKRLQSVGFKLPIVVSQLAYVSRHATIGNGAIVMHGAVINAGATIGDNCIINSKSLIEHDAVVADHCHIATAAVVNGGVRVGFGTFIGSQSTIKQGVVIGERCVIGMGQRVLRDCETGTYMPTSARHA